MESHKSKNSYYAVLLVIILIGIFYSVTIRDGLDWDGDNSHYIHHAKNIAEGKPYKNTGYVHNPSNPAIGPKTYPPVFPTLLAPVYLIAGLNFQVMKFVTIFFFLISLYIIFLNFKDDLPTIYVLLIIGLIGFNYFFWDFKDRIQSDLFFLLFAYTFIYFAMETYKLQESSKRAIVIAALAGIFLYLSYGTRSVGVVLLPSIILFELINYRKISYKTIVIFSVFLSLALLQSMLYHADTSEGSYLDRFYFDPTIVIDNLKIYKEDASALWANDYSSMVNKVIFLAFSFSSLAGYIIRFRKIGIHEIFFGAYLTIIILWPGNQGTRFLIPLIPLYIFYFFYFVNFLNRKFSNRNIFGKAISLALLIGLGSIGFSYAHVYYKRGFKPIYHGVHRTSSIEMFNFIKNNTTMSDVIIFRKPRVLGLITSRSSACYHFSENEQELWNYFTDIGATYLIEEKIFGGDFSSYFRSFIKKHEDRLMRVFSNSDFNIYKIKESYEKNC